MTSGSSFLEFGAFFLLFVLAWVGSGYLIAQMGGWKALGQMFPRKKRLEASKIRFCSLSFVGKWVFPINYASCVDVAVSDDEIFLSVFPLFRAGHPPLEIPWKRVDECHRKDGLWLGSETAIKVGVGGGSSQTIRFYGKAGKNVFEKWTRRGWDDQSDS